MIPQFLTEKYPLEKHLFLVPKFCLVAIGFYPKTQRTIWIYIWAGINLTLLSYGCYVELYFGLHNLSINVLDALEALCPVSSSITSVFKVIFIWYYRVEFAALIDRVRILSAAECTPQKLRLKRKHYSIATRLTALLVFFGLGTNLAYSLRPILLNTLRYMNGEEWLYQTPFKMMLPKVLVSMPIYPITYLILYWHGFITVVASVGGDGFFLGFCMYFTALLESLQEDVKVALGELKATENPHSIESQRANEHCAKLLAGIIDRHNEIFELTQKFSKVVVGITLAHFLSSSTIIGMSVFIVLLYSGMGIAIYVGMCFTVTTQIFLYCYGGTAVSESSEELGTTVYCSQWYTRNIPVQKMVLLLIERCQQPFLVKIPFFAPSLPVLTSILRFAGSIIALGKSVL